MPIRVAQVCLWPLLWCACLGVAAQPADVQVKVYDLEAGLSHRSVFKIGQDTAGFIWMATLDGLDRFDGHRFLHHGSRVPGLRRLPFDAMSDMLLHEGRIWLANPDHLTCLWPATGHTVTHPLKRGPLVRREAKVPHNLLLDTLGQLWMAAFDEKSARTHIMALDTATGRVRTLLEAEGQYTKRPLAQVGPHLYLGAYEEALWQLAPDGTVLARHRLPLAGADRARSRVVCLQPDGPHRLWVLLADGRLFGHDTRTGLHTPHPLNGQLPRRLFAGALLVTPDGGVWIGGQGHLLHYDPRSGRLHNYDDPVRQLVKNTVTYRHLFKDRSNTLWAASDFGAIRLVRSEALFNHYLSGGSEYCSNVYCSTRGITEDEQGRIYIAYYNALHVLDPSRNTLRPLFPSNDYFNYPFGLAHHQGALYTCNGLRIDLATLAVDTVFYHGSVDLGDVTLMRDGHLWFGYQHWLYRYDPMGRVLQPFQQAFQDWEAQGVQVSQVYQGPSSDDLWVATLGHGVYRFNPTTLAHTHYHTEGTSTPALAHPQVNVVHQDSAGRVWLGGPAGLQCLSADGQDLRLFTTADGMPNDFVNGILPEGDSCLWVSTNNGLCRFDVRNHDFANFYTDNGLSSNEFNRISFHRATDGRMYFGGLNGVNAFYPSEQFLRAAHVRPDAPVLLTAFARLDGRTDSILTQTHGLHHGMSITLSHLDRAFAFEFALADYRHPSLNRYAYFLEGFEKEWSAPTAVHTARYQNIPPGTYTFRVRAHAGQGLWSSRELAVRVVVRQAFYKSWGFVVLCLMAVGAILYALVRYRLYNLQRRRDELEATVAARTHELQVEKQKSDELLLNILPADIAEELRRHGHAKARRHEAVTVLFSDFVGFSRLAGQMSPEALVAEIDLCFRAFDDIVDKYGLEKIKTVGDAYLCVEGIGTGQARGAAAAVKVALAMQAFLEGLRAEREPQGLTCFRARIGIHTGPVVAGIVGTRKFAYDIWGNTVNIASRMETHGQPGRVNISEATWDLVKGQFDCTPHGHFQEYGLRPMRMFLVDEGRREE